MIRIIAGNQARAQLAAVERLETQDRRARVDQNARGANYPLAPPTLRPSARMNRADGQQAFASGTIPVGALD